MHDTEFMMDAPTILFALALAGTALASPFALRFDHGGLASSPLAERARSILFVLMSLLFTTGFVGLAAAGVGALLGFDGMAAMIPLAWLWAPLVLLGTFAATRRGFGGRGA
jgi:hypothetical protein